MVLADGAYPPSASNCLAYHKLSHSRAHAQRLGRLVANLDDSKITLVGATLLQAEDAFVTPPHCQPRRPPLHDDDGPQGLLLLLCPPLPSSATTTAASIRLASSPVYGT